MTTSGLSVDLKTTVNDFVLACEFEVPVGASLAVVGPNGSGKSTLLSALAGLVDVDRGRVVISGHVVVDSTKDLVVAPEKRSVAIVPQKSLLFPHMTVAENVAFGLRYRPVEDAESAISNVLKDVGLDRFRDRKPGQLSGGQQQRASLARALVVQPNLLLADEPLSNVDADSRHSLRSVMDQWRPPTQTQVIVTHGHHHAQAADLLVGLEAGRVAAFGEPRQLANDTKLDWLRDLLRASD